MIYIINLLREIKKDKHKETLIDTFSFDYKLLSQIAGSHISIANNYHENILKLCLIKYSLIFLWTNK